MVGDTKALRALANVLDNDVLGYPNDETPLIRSAADTIDALRDRVEQDAKDYERLGVDFNLASAQRALAESECDILRRQRDDAVTTLEDAWAERDALRTENDDQTARLGTALRAQEDENARLRRIIAEARQQIEHPHPDDFDNEAAVYAILSRIDEVPVSEDYIECGDRHPNFPVVTSRCTQPIGHDGPHVNVDHPLAGQWEEK